MESTPEKSALFGLGAVKDGFGLSRRQAYRYLEEAQGIAAPVPVSVPSIPITIKVPEDIAAKLRSYAQSSGLSMGDIVARAVLSFLAKVGWRG
jgi:hypothetical protein